MAATAGFLAAVIATVIAPAAGRPTLGSGENATALDVPFAHASYGYSVYVTISMGTPKQSVGVLFDTGSSTLGLTGPASKGRNPVCTSAQDYFSQGCAVGQYDPSLSDTQIPIPASGPVNIPNVPPEDVMHGRAQPGCGTPVPGNNGSQVCGGAVVYGVGSDTTGMEGYWTTDIFSLGNLSARVPFLTITKMKYDFEEPPVGGIMGVSTLIGNCLPSTMAAASSGGAGGQATVTCVVNAMHSLLTQSGYTDKFGVCLGDPGKTGVLTLGGGNPNYYTGPMTYIPLHEQQVSSDYYYSVSTQGIYVGGTGKLKAACTSPTTCGGPLSFSVIDSGTNIFILYEQAFYGVQEASQQITCTNDHDCDLSVELGEPGEEVCLRTTGFWACKAGQCQPQRSPDTGEPMIQPDPQQTIIGYAVIRQLYVIFDRGVFPPPPSGANGRVGFATRSGECATPCSAWLSEWPCTLAAKCQWNSASNSCYGTQPESTIDKGGKGSFVRAGKCQDQFDAADEHAVEI